MRSENKVSTSTSPLLLASLAVDTLEVVGINGLPGSVHVEEVDEEVVGQLAWTLSEDTG